MRHKQRILILGVFLCAAALTGVVCVFFMRSFDFMIRHRLDFLSIGGWSWLVTPLAFTFFYAAIDFAAPLASGTGIPQVIFGATHMQEKTEKALAPLLSFKTLMIKILALLGAVWVGASTGREGPTVHIAACVFFLIILLFKKWFKIKVDLRSAIVAGGAAGLAAAFNTPLAGVTFAIEELVPDYFSSIKDFVLLAIIVAALTAKSLTGEYSYFGKLLEPPSAPFLSIVWIGLAGGCLGAFFSTALLKGQQRLASYQQNKKRWLIPVIFALSLLSLARIFGTTILGPGNETAQMLLQGRPEHGIFSFPFTKIAATLFTYWSGMAGGIFAPSLAIGAALGAGMGTWLHLATSSCALIGMAAFLSGTIQAPITVFVIVFEMTGHHQMLLPVMLASLLASLIAKVVGAKHLYKSLADNYKPLLQIENPDRQIIPPQ